MGKGNNAYDKFSKNNFKNSTLNNTRYNRNTFPRYNLNYNNQNVDEDVEDETVTDMAVKTAGKVAATSAFGSLGGYAYDVVSSIEVGKRFIKKTSKKVKLYLYVGIGFVLLFILLAVFMVLFIDATMSNILNFTNWNFGSSSSPSEVIDSNSNFSSSESSSIKDNTLLSLIGEDGISKLESDIGSVVINSCSGRNVASVAVKLLDGLNEYGYRVPYSSYNKINYNSVIDSNWGGSFTEDEVEYIYGFNSYTFLGWVFSNSKVNMIDSLNEIINVGEIKSLSSVVPGDIVLNDDNALLVIQNVGSSITVAEVSSDGLKYSEYKNSDLTDYVAVGMDNYYSNNCSV